MKIRNITAVMGVSLAVLMLAGCGTKEEKKSTASCTITVKSVYGGYGEDGNDLGSGEFTESFTIHEGDEFYEDYGGHWLFERPKKSDCEMIAEIKKIGQDKVVWSVDGQEKNAVYSAVNKVSSKYTVADGINYNYEVTFTDYLP
ncbi:hypothetical protein [uncultured Ruminococcus sp.]|uniref:hypothetical protein n=1 Tax=uncultured Ruminococcus sp. TaxID=165186 RepID=UPI0026130BFB|nr:hypothetical protein [uncultured Ruminococcus sp.]